MTLIDLLVVISGVLPAMVIVGLGPEPWRVVLACVLTFVFGIGQWVLIFIWWLPRLTRRRERDNSARSRKGDV